MPWGFYRLRWPRQAAFVSEREQSYRQEPNNRLVPEPWQRGRRARSQPPTPQNRMENSFQAEALPVIESRSVLSSAEPYFAGAAGLKSWSRLSVLATCTASRCRRSHLSGVHSASPRATIVHWLLPDGRSTATPWHLARAPLGCHWRVPPSRIPK